MSGKPKYEASDMGLRSSDAEGTTYEDSQRVVNETSRHASIGVCLDYRYREGDGVVEFVEAVCTGLEKWVGPISINTWHRTLGIDISLPVIWSSAPLAVGVLNHVYTRVAGIPSADASELERDRSKLGRNLVEDTVTIMIREAIEPLPDVLAEVTLGTVYRYMTRGPEACSDLGEASLAYVKTLAGHLLRKYRLPLITAERLAKIEEDVGADQMNLLTTLGTPAYRAGCRELLQGYAAVGRGKRLILQVVESPAADRLVEFIRGVERVKYGLVQQTIISRNRGQVTIGLRSEWSRQAILLGYLNLVWRMEGSDRDADIQISRLIDSLEIDLVADAATIMAIARKGTGNFGEGYRVGPLRLYSAIATGLGIEGPDMQRAQGTYADSIYSAVFENYASRPRTLQNKEEEY